ncbi:MAG: IS4 family transposase [Chloroflexi bacterium]|nr:IS4 family transposase [Chloroflexota bacterium]
MVFSSSQPANRGSLLQLVGFFLGAALILFPDRNITTLSKVAVSKRLSNVSWYLFRGVYNHLLSRYTDILNAEDNKFLKQFKEAFAIDGSVIALSKVMEKVFESVHKGKSSLKLNAKYSMKTEVVTKLQVTSGKRHDSQFRFVTQVENCLYLIDLGYWSYTLINKIITVGSFFVMRLKSSCDPLITAINCNTHQHLVGKRLSEIGCFLNTQAATGYVDLAVTLSKAAKPRFNDRVRLVGVFYEGEWRFYITNIFNVAFSPQVIYDVYASRWQIEIFFNLIKNILKLDNIISRTKNGIMIEIYSALIFYLLVRIIMALAAQKTGKSIHELSFECSYKLVQGFMLSHFHRFLEPSLQAVEVMFEHMIDIVAMMGFSRKKSQMVKLHECFA